MGLTPIPCRYGSKTPIIKWGEWVGRKPDDVQLEKWFMYSGRVNLALLINPDWVVLDFDRIGSYLAWSDKYPQATKSYTVKTARGVHVYLRVDDYVVVTGSMRDYDGEVKATGIVMAPPSAHPDGKHVYYAVDNSEPLRVGCLQEIGMYVRTATISPVVDRTPAYVEGGIIDRIKALMPIETYLARLVNGGFYAGRDGTYMCLCPFHDDRNPSLWVIPQEGRAYCFSPHCRAHKRCDVVNCAAMYNGCSTAEAVKLLCDDLGLEYVT